jgi:hypothetical protein
MSEEEEEKEVKLNLCINNASTGDSFISNSTSVEQIRAQIVKRFEIHVENQVIISQDGEFLNAFTSKEGLLVGDLIRKNDGESLSLFVFNKKWTLSNITLSSSINEFFKSFVIPDIKNFVADVKSNPLEKLSQIADQMKWNSKICECYISRFMNAVDIGEKLSDQIKLRINGLVSLLKNLDLQLLDYSEIVQNILAQFSKRSLDWAGYTKNFEDNIQKISRIKLHPGFRNASRTTLLECISERDIRDWNIGCTEALKKLSKRLEDVDKTHKELQKKVSEEMPSKESIHGLTNFSVFSESISSWKENLIFIQGINANLMIDCSEVLGLLEKARISGFNVLKIDEMTRWQNVCNKQEDNLLDMKRKDNIMISQINFMSETQVRISKELGSLLSKIAGYQESMDCSRRDIEVFFGSLKKMDEKMAPIVAVSNLISAYDRSIIEISRRKSFFQKYKADIERISQALARTRDAEIEQRYTFMREFGKFVPKTLADFSNRPPICELQLRSFDPEWKEFDISDVQVQEDFFENYLSPFTVFDSASSNLKPQASQDSSELQELRLKLDQLQSENLVLKSEKFHVEKTSQSEITLLSKSVESMKLEMESKKAEIQSMQLKIDEYNFLKSQLENSNKDLRNHLEEIGLKFAQADQQIINLKEENETHKSESMKLSVNLFNFDLCF